MALTKRVYVDGETIITADNLNAIQDEIISQGVNKVPTTRKINNNALSSDVTLTANDVPYSASTSYSASTVGKAIKDASEVANSAVAKSTTSYIGGATVSYTGDRQTQTTNVDLVSGHQYLLVRKTDMSSTDYVRVFSGGTSSNYVDLNAPGYLVTYTPNTTGKMTLYNRGAFTGSFSVAVFEYNNPDIVLHDEVYFVDKNAFYKGAYTSFTQCLLDLKTNYNNKTIFVMGGDYDIYAEYVAANVPVYTGNDPMSDYFDYNVWIPDNTHIIGCGIVRFKWQPTTSQATYNQSRTVSPINVAGSMTLENVEIYCKNGRYCIHDDANGNWKYNHSVKRYINVKCYKLANDSNYGTIHTIGIGVDREQYYVFEHCLFNNVVSGNCFYAHSRQNVNGDLSENNSSNLLLDDCIFNGNGTTCVRFANSSNVTDQIIRVSINNSTFTQEVLLEGTPNKFALTLNNSGSPTINIDDTSNSYAPVLFNSSYAAGRTKAEFKKGLDLVSAFAVDILSIIGTTTGNGSNKYYISNNYRGIWFVISNTSISAMYYVQATSAGAVSFAELKFTPSDTTLTLSASATRELSITSTTTANLSISAFTINGSKPYRKEST